MEFGSEISGHEVKDEKRSESSVGDEEDRREQEIVTQEPPLSTTERSTVEAGPNASSLTKKEEAVDELEDAKAKMGEVMEENQRLKTCLNRILSDYRTLQMQFHNIAEQETKDSSDQKVNNNNDHYQIEESDLVSLSLGRLPTRNNNKVPNNKPLKEEAEKEDKEGLPLGLDCKFETSKSGIISTTEHLPNHQSPNNSVEEVPKEEVAGESWQPGKGHKTARDATVEDEVSQQNPAKKARVCVRARCDTPTMNDGCQWRKYGQKISKGNPCPRAYYRCTVATSCPVRKQVQRCAQDMSILITTYEGNHNHPLSLSATAMASTTSAAASMLLSGSSTSHSGTRPSTAMTTAVAAADLHGMNFFLSDGSKLSNQYYLSHPTALSSSPSHPTIILDLTSNNNPSSSSSAPLVKFTSNSNYNNTQRYPLSTSLNFSSSESNNAITSWSNNGFLSYNNTLAYNSNRNVTNVLSNINLGTQQQQQPMENIYNSYMQRNNNVPISPPQHSLPDTIAAATKVITADPNFQSALAAALTTIIGSGSTTQGNHGAAGENLSQKMKWGELFPSSSALPSSSTKVNGCASSFLNKSAANTQPGTAPMFLQPPLPLSSPKSASGSPGDHRDKRN